jgi:hypothetical protein
MKKILAVAFLTLGLNGCALHTVVPSFWDDNQSVAIIDTRQAVEQLDCTQPHAPQVKVIKNRLEWFDLYSESKGMQQNDVRELIKPMKETVDDFYKRSVEKEGSKAYCEAKKKVMRTQASKAAESVLGRW